MTALNDTKGIPSGLKRADILLILPFVWQLGLASWANGVAWSPLGIPFGMAWQMAGIVFATMVLALRFSLEGKSGSGASEQEGAE